MPGLSPILHRRMTSPFGDIWLVAEVEEADAADAARSARLTGLYFDGQKHQPDLTAMGQADARLPLFDETIRQLQAFFDGRRRDFDLPLRPQGTPFQHAVWQALCRIPAGDTLTYGALAAMLGKPAAARAVGAATGRNPLSLIIPCHRLVGQGGALTGYAGGMQRKRDLLDFERRQFASSSCLI